MDRGADSRASACLRPLAAHHPAAAALLASLAACADAPPPAWTDLSARFEVEHRHGSFEHPWRAGRPATVEATPDGQTLTIPLERADWTRVADTEVWRTPLALSLPKHRRGVTLRMETPAGRIPRADLVAVRDAGAMEGFALFQDSVVFGGEPPERATLTCTVPHPSVARDGRVSGPDYCGDGFLLQSGARAVCEIPLPPGSALSFATLVEPTLTPPELDLAVTVRVRADGALVHEHDETFREPGLPAWHRVELPDGCARLELEVEGMLATVAVLDPTAGPLDVGARGARPWGDARSDIVLFLADTFRADNLGAYGGTAEVTPNLDALADASLCFTRAWSTSTWTLPSHATIFSGFLPFQAGTTSEVQQLPASLLTLPEMLVHAGYRTGAFTDGAFVSGEFGLDQGFEVFSERTRDLDEKLEEVRRFLAADDGRPVFLFVHTYRVHWPYRFGEETLREHGERLGIRGKAGELLADALEEVRGQGDQGARYLADLTDLHHTPRMGEIADRLRAHYLGGVAELDRDFAGFMTILRESGVLERGFLVFTSDHGEAFLEHGGLFHSQLPWEEQARIPLLVHGGALAPARIDHPVSLLDLAPTFADMAGIAPQPSWLGRSLLDSIPGRPVLSYRVATADGDGFAVVDGGRKLMLLRHPAPPDERILGAYDLAGDAAERHDLASDARWPRELLERHADLLEHALEPVVQGEAAELDPERAAELRALGY